MDRGCEQFFVKLGKAPYSTTTWMNGRLGEHYARSSLDC